MIIVPDMKTLSVVPRYCPVAPQYIVYESAYSIISRFSLYNVIRGDALVRIFAPPKDPAGGKRSRWLNLAHSASVNPAALQECFALDGAQRNSLFLVPSALPFSDYVATTLRVCQVCLARGVHYSLFQYLLIQQCPIHQVELTQACRTCGGAMDYSLNSGLFHMPYGCHHCGRLLRRKGSSSGWSYLNKSGLDRLTLAHRIFDRGRDRKIYFDISQPTNVYFDNAVQFSSATQDFALHQRALFLEVQCSIAAGQGRPDACFYRTMNIGRRVPVEETLNDEAVTALVSTLKCIFRQMRKRFLPGIRLSHQLLAGMWRSIEGSEIPRRGYHLVGYLDWLCFWYGVQAPADLCSKARLCVIGKLRAWLDSKRIHEVFTLLKGRREKQWLILKILAHEVIYFMVRQLQTLSAAAPSDCATQSSHVTYHRTIRPAAWAVVVLANDVTCTFHFSARSASTELSRSGMSAAEQKETVASLSR